MDKKKKLTIAGISGAIVLIIGIIAGIVLSKGDKGGEESTLQPPKVVDNNQRGDEELLGHEGPSETNKGPHGSTEERFIGSWTEQAEELTVVISKNDDGTYSFTFSSSTQEGGQSEVASGTVEADNSTLEFKVISGSTPYKGSHKYKVQEKGYDFYLVLDSGSNEKWFRYNEQYSSSYRIPGLDSALEEGQIVPGGEVIEVDPNKPDEVIPGLTPDQIEINDPDGDDLVEDGAEPVEDENEDNGEDNEDNESEDQPEE